MRFLSTFLILLLAIGFTSCEKDQELTTTTTTSTVAGELEQITASFNGRVVDTDGESVANAIVTVGNKTATTNEDGLWSVDNARVAATFGYVTFNSNQHVFGSRTVYARNGQDYRIDVELLSRNQSYSVDGQAGGSVELAGSAATVTFPEAAFTRTDGSAYTGQVNVVAHYLDPSDPTTVLRMPGDLRALAADASSATDFTLLTSFGMMAVELTDNGGATLELAEGKDATLSMPIPAASATSAPDQIPLWYFDDADGVWKEEGFATKQGDAYVGTVSHFTFWNCDIPTDNVELCGNVSIAGQSSGDTLNNTNVRMTIESNVWGTRGGYTDANGDFCGLIPANEVLTFNVYGLCGDAIYSVQIGPFSENTVLDPIVLPNIVADITIEGSAECNGTPITSGAVRVFQNGLRVQTFGINPDGTFSSTMILCDTSEIRVEIADYDNLSTSDPQTYAYSPMINTGVIASCQQVLTNYFEVIVDGVSLIGDSCLIGSDGPNFVYSSGQGFDQNNPNGFGYDFNADSTNIDITTVGVYQSGGTSSFLNVTHPELPFGGAWRIQEDYDVTISTVATQTQPFTVGMIGPVQYISTDSVAGGGLVTDTFNIEINFSARTY